MTHEEALFLRDTLVDRLEHEYTATRRALAALPEDQLDYKPHPQARSAFELAWHIVDIETVLLGAIAQGSFEEMRPSDEMPESLEELLSYSDALIPPLRDSVRELDAETLTAPAALGKTVQPLVSHLFYVLGHTIHHRGQLTTYLRAMGARVPGPYGRSADERRGD